jgi:GNAT superfamily N-acetyltransferase
MNIGTISYRQLDNSDSEMISAEFHLKFLFSDKILGFGAFSGDFLIGMIITANQVKQFEIQYFTITPLFRGHGIGSNLLVYTQKILRERSKKKQFVSYFDSHTCDPRKASDFFQKNEWKVTPYYYQLRIELRDLPEFMLERNLCMIGQRLHEVSIRILTLNDLKPKHHQAINIECEKLEDYLYPLELSGGIMPELCFFCCKENNIIGWIIAQYNIQKQGIIVKSLYIRKDYRKSDFFKLLLAFFHQRTIITLPNLKFYSFNYDPCLHVLGRLYNIHFKSSNLQRSLHYIAVKN